jgi:rhodanese-related sulfurtransferase
MRFWLAAFAFVAVVLPGSVITGERAPAAESASVQPQIRAMYEEILQRKLGDVPDLEPLEAMELADSLDLWIVDVRGRKERDVSVIPGSMPREEFRERFESIPPRPVLVYCTIGQRSGEFTKKLRSEGVEAYNLAGGILLWVAEGGGVVDGSSGEPTRRVHVYGSRWNLLPESYEAVW